MSLESKKLLDRTTQIRSDFPILDRKINGKRLAYLDNAASSQKPMQVISKINDLYSNYYANVHRGVHSLSMESTEAYESVREKVAKFINAGNINEIIFTKGTTDSINLFAQSWAKNNLKKGDRIVLSEIEHHANLVPWFMLRDEIGIELAFIPVLDDYTLDIEAAKKIINSNTRLVSISHISNSLGTIVPIKDIIDLAHHNNAIVLIDGAQSIPHQNMNVIDLDIDVLVFSAHKMLGPTGVGILWAKMDILKQCEPVIGGGDMISKVTFDGALWNDIPFRFEAGTPNIAGVIGFGEAIDYLNEINYIDLCNQSHVISEYTRNLLEEMEFVEILGPKDKLLRTSLFSFDIKNIHPHDVAQILDSEGVAVRAGHHCAQPTLNKFGFSSTVRASFYFYNNFEDANQLIESLQIVKKRFLQ
ncbi:MAG: cysteine desulfurase / selenocysteine lyase [Chloroflexi bacterium]|mgnify:CR=1 FL=1|jgi:cysteine desulfurase/selenocysteine lyase|nr:MAG: cysteine desulfurase / selenocysteine lyase [Chloroflexota bacterium]|tara:strand:+ start:3016 stop:4266 length:1251 start_codon:yes stop_codon:yes gene_type:complete